MGKTKCKPIKDYPDILVADDIASYLRISKTGAYELMKRRDFPTIKIGRKKMTFKEYFIQWIQNNSRKI